MNKSKGFTLIELVVALAISTIILGVIFVVFSSIMKTYTNEKNRILLQDANRIVSLTIEGDIRKSSQSISIVEDGACFQIVDTIMGSSTTYCIEENTVSRDGVFLSDNIQDVNLVLNGNAVTLDIIVFSAEETLNYEKTIYLR